MICVRICAILEAPGRQYRPQEDNTGKHTGGEYKMEAKLTDLNASEPKSKEERYQEKMLRMARLRTGAMLVAAAVLLLLGFMVMQWGGQLQAMMNSAQHILADAQTSVSNLNGLTAELQRSNISGLLSEMGVLVEDAQVAVEGAVDGMGQAVGKIEELDIATLNQAIEDLSAVVEPLAKLFGGRR